MAIEADNLRGKILADVQRKEGASPILPKRKRGFHRALKRKEMWAILEKYQRETINNMAQRLYQGMNNG